MEEPVDFAIITALPIERKAVVSRLTTSQKVQEAGEPLTFYLGNVPIPGEATPYSVVVTQLLDMGNLDAAAATARVLQRFRPRNVLMVGIAGGVRGEVTLGDVVVARQACYYEPAKLRPGRDEPRERQFHADAMLLGRAQHYEESDWTAQIEVARPGEAAPPDSHPRAHVGTIACGEKVVADLAELARIAKVCPKMLAVAMEGAGVARAVLTVDRPPRYLEIRGVSDYAGPDKTDGWHEYAANAAAAFAFGFLRSRPIPPGPPPEDRPGAAEAPTLIISAQSLRPIELREFLPALDPSFQRREVDFLPLDFTDLAPNKAITDPEAAARRVAGPQGVLLTALARRGDARLVFHGLASIPLLVLAGHVVSDRRPVALFDYHPVPGTWAWPGTGEEFPGMAATGVPKRRVSDDCEVVVRMGVSYPVLPEPTLVAVPTPRVQIDFAVPAPERSVVRSEAQTRAYGAAFRAVLDGLRKTVPNCRRVHLFYAGPVSLGFHLGQQVSENIHPPVVAWNFTRAYDWGIDLGKAVAGEPCVVRPPAVATEGT